jgi:hypothetical protein
MELRQLEQGDQLVLDADVWQYDYTLVVDGREQRIPCLARQDPLRPDTNLVHVQYRVAGVIEGRDEWHILDATEDHVLIYYCGSSAPLVSGEYQGAIVMVRSGSRGSGGGRCRQDAFGSSLIPAHVRHRFEQTLRLADIGIQSLDQFCDNPVWSTVNSGHALLV